MEVTKWSEIPYLKRPTLLSFSFETQRKKKRPFQSLLHFWSERVVPVAFIKDRKNIYSSGINNSGINNKNISTASNLEQFSFFILFPFPSNAKYTITGQISIRRSEANSSRRTRKTIIVHFRRVSNGLFLSSNRK